MKIIELHETICLKLKGSVLLSSRPRSWSRVHSSSFCQGLGLGLGLGGQGLGLGLGLGGQGLGLGLGGQGLGLGLGLGGQGLGLGLGRQGLVKTKTRVESSLHNKFLLCSLSKLSYN